MALKRNNVSTVIFILLTLLVLAIVSIVMFKNHQKALANKIYQVTEVEENQKLTGREIKLQAAVFLTSNMDKTLFYVVDLKLADKLNSPDCGIYNIPVHFTGTIPNRGSKIEIVGKASGLFSNGTLKFEASQVNVMK
jgi:uncharacterized membrane protein affecting hemolysin expression